MLPYKYIKLLKQNGEKQIKQFPVRRVKNEKSQKDVVVKSRTGYLIAFRRKAMSEYENRKKHLLHEKQLEKPPNMK